MRFREKIARFMYGRYGMDPFGRFLVIAALVLLVASMFFGGVANWILWVLGLAALVWCYARALSRKYDKRWAENDKYLRVKNAVKRYFASLKTRWTQRKDYRFFRCPSCHALLRVPKGKGRIQLTCRKCGNRFERKS